MKIDRMSEQLENASLGKNSSPGLYMAGKNICKWIGKSHPAHNVVVRAPAYA